MRTPISQERQAILSAMPEAERLANYRALWKLGYDVPPPQPKASNTTPKGVGDRLKASLSWTGIPSCQMCSGLMKELNVAGPDAVRADIEAWAGRLVSNLRALSDGHAVNVSWWTRLKAKGAMVLLGEASAHDYARSYLLSACDASERSTPPSISLV
jgi:hypothetical protein